MSDLVVSINGAPVPIYLGEQTELARLYALSAKSDAALTAEDRLAAETAASTAATDAVALVAAAVEEDADRAEAAAATFEGLAYRTHRLIARRNQLPLHVLGKGLPTVTFLTELSDNTPRAALEALPECVIDKIVWKVSTPGQFEFTLARAKRPGKAEHYTLVAVDGSAGGIVETEFPDGLVVLPNSSLFLRCPTAGGKVAAFVSSSGALPAGENEYDLQIPAGSYFAEAGGGLGEKAVTHQTTGRLFAIEIHARVVPEVPGPTRSSFVFDMDFTTLGLAFGGAAWTFNGAYAQAVTVGRAGHMRAVGPWACDRREARFVVSCSDAATRPVAAFRPAHGQHGTAARANPALGTWEVARIASATSEPDWAAGTSRPLPAGIDATKRIEFQFRRRDRLIAVSIGDADNPAGATDQYIHDWNGAPASPGAPAAELLHLGLLNGEPAVWGDGSAARSHVIEDRVLDRHATSAIFADSIGNGSRNAYANCWTVMVRDYLREVTGETCSIHAVDGIDPNNAIRMFQRMIGQMPNLRKVIFPLGTNRGSGSDATRDLNMFKVASNTAKRLCEERGIEAWWGVPAPHWVSPTLASQQTYLAHLQDTNWNLIRFDLALTVGGDGVTIDDSLFFGPSDVHPVTGQPLMFERVKTDAPTFFM